MPLRLIAKDLYQLLRAVDRLEKELVDCPPARRDALKRKLVRARIEYDRMRAVLDGRLAR